MSNIQEEIWKDVVGYEGFYKVSNRSRIRSLARPKTRDRFLRHKFHKKGYMEFTLCRDSICKKYKAHRLVAIAFIPNPYNKPQVNHINGVKDDNRPENLEWCTGSENMKHSFQCLDRASPDGGKQPVYQFSFDGFLVGEYGSVTEATKSTGISHIACAARGDRNHAGGFKWAY